MGSPWVTPKIKNNFFSETTKSDHKLSKTFYFIKIYFFVWVINVFLSVFIGLIPIFSELLDCKREVSYINWILSVSISLKIRKKNKVGVVLMQNLGQIRGNVCKNKKKRNIFCMRNTFRSEQGPSTNNFPHT